MAEQLVGLATVVWLCSISYMFIVFRDFWFTPYRIDTGWHFLQKCSGVTTCVRDVIRVASHMTGTSPHSLPEFKNNSRKPLTLELTCLLTLHRPSSSHFVLLFYLPGPNFSPPTRGSIKQVRDVFIKKSVKKKKKPFWSFYYSVLYRRTKNLALY